MKLKNGFVKLAGILAVCAALILAPLQTAQAEETLPSATVDSVTWDGGMLEVPVDLGSYAGEEDLSVCIIIPDDVPHGAGLYTHLWGKIEGNKAIFSLWDLFRSSDEEYFFSKAGTYEMTMEFEVPDEEAGSGYTKVVSSDSFKLIIPSDSQQWRIQRSTVKFDGSEDIVFHFENGTNFWELENVSGIHVFLAKGIGFDLYDGYTFDPESGIVRIDKDAFINALKDFVRYYNEALDIELSIEYYEAVFIELTGVTTGGVEIPRYINTIDYEGSEHFETDIAWKVDLTGLDLSGEEGNVTSEFAGTSSDSISVPEQTGTLIGQNALSYIQANYAEQLAGLGSYTVRARLELAELDENDLDQAVKTAFAPYLADRTAGKYYTVEIVADVVKEGQIVTGLENIIIPQLSEDAEVALRIPENLIKSGRTYEMLHYQDGTAELISCEEKDGMITFRTDSFSPYALVYRDTTENMGSTDGTGADNTGATNNAVNPKTGDYEGTAYAAGMLVVSLSILAFTVVRKRSRL